MSYTLPFPSSPRARADFKAGAAYAIDGGDSYIYFAQMAPNGQLGFFRHRSREAASPAAFKAPVMSRFAVTRPSIGRALREGKWLLLGREALRAELQEEPVVVQWPVGTLEVKLWKSSAVVGLTTVDDPAIQDLEIIATYDAIHHVPSRLQADFTQGADAWSSGGSIKRERLKKQDLARRFPEQPWHQLPSNWVVVEK